MITAAETHSLKISNIKFSSLVKLIFLSYIPLILLTLLYQGLDLSLNQNLFETYEGMGIAGYIAIILLVVPIAFIVIALSAVILALSLRLIGILNPFELHLKGAEE